MQDILYEVLTMNECIKIVIAIYMGKEMEDEKKEEKSRIYIWSISPTIHFI